jgi:hypothetical protein
MTDRLITLKKVGNRHPDAFLDGNVCIVFAPGGSQPPPHLAHPFVQRLLNFGPRCVVGVDLAMRRRWSALESVHDLRRCFDVWHEREFGSTSTVVKMILIGYSTGSWLLNKFWLTQRPTWFAADSWLVDIAGTLKPQPGAHTDIVSQYWTEAACEQDRKRMALMEKFHGTQWRNVVNTIGSRNRRRIRSTQRAKNCVVL